MLISLDRQAQMRAEQSQMRAERARQVEQPRPLIPPASSGPG